MENTGKLLRVIFWVKLLGVKKPSATFIIENSIDASKILTL